MINESGLCSLCRSILNEGKTCEHNSCLNNVQICGKKKIKKYLFT